MCCYSAIFIWLREYRGFPDSSVVKNLPAVRGCKRFWFDPWVGKTPWRRKWQPSPVFLTEKPHGQRNLVGQRVTKSWTCLSDWVHTCEESSEVVVLCLSTCNGILHMAELDVCWMTKWINAGLSASKPCLSFPSKGTAFWPFSLSLYPH